MRQLAFAVLSSALVLVFDTAVWAAQLDCPKVISAISRSADGVPGHSADISVTAKKLGTSVAWIEHCMRIYGRRPRRPGLESAEGREGRLEAMEDYEAEEPIEPEDRGEADVPRTRERQPHIKVKPPPDPWSEE